MERCRCCLPNVMRLEGSEELGQRAEEGRSRIVGVLFLNQTIGPRPDAMSYCLDALERFEGMPHPEVQKITLEITMLGSRGINLNDSAKKHTLQSLPGAFSGLHLLCLQYICGLQATRSYHRRRHRPLS